METSRRIRVVVAVTVLLLIPFTAASESAVPGEDAVVRAPPKEGRADDMSAWSVDSGGGESSGGDFSLTAAIGQPDAGLVSQGGTVLAGGLWGGALDLQSIYSNGFESGDTGSWSSVVGGT